MTRPPSRPRRWFATLWWLLDASRRAVLNLLFLALIVAVVFALVRRGPPPIADKTALVIELKGPITEQRTGSFRSSALGQFRGDSVQQTRLRDVLAAFDAAAKDPKIGSVLLVLDDFQGAGPATLNEVGAALDRFKATGKPVVAWGSSYDQRQYSLAAHASEVLMHPFGMVYLDGYGRLRNYYRDALDKLGVTVNLLRVGTYKSAAEPYIANGPSPAAKEADAYLNGALWADYTAGVEQARKLPAGSVMRVIDGLPQSLVAVGGDGARLALEAKLVDGLKTRDEVRQLMIARGAVDEANHTFRQIGLDEYLGRQKTIEIGGDAIAVVVAEGEIVDGHAGGGTVGGLSTSELIRQARDDERIKAIVLRVNSPGGSVFGSELVRRELELARSAGKPVVVSMGDVAASGGYWISTASDEVIADRDTITGSIGVFALLPSADKLLDKLGVHTDGTPTTWLGGAGDVRRPLDPRFAQLMQAGIDHIYADFTAKVAQARKTTPQKIDAIGQGRVWTGAQAKERGLVDTIGSFADAIASAAKRGKLGAGYRVVYIEPEPGKLELLLQSVGDSAANAAVKAIAGRIDPQQAATGVPAALTRDLSREAVRDFGWLAELNAGRRRFVAVTHCMCSVP